MHGTLFIVAVPIGNLEDITLRAQRILGEVELVACEDTRRTGQLFKRLGIKRSRLLAVHDHNESERAPQIIKVLESGQNVALVSDAGTPAISDPGHRVVRAVIEAGLPVVPIPGVSAVTTAICAAGLPTDRYRFIGFLPARRQARCTALDALRGAEETLVFYESPHRLTAFLKDAVTAFGSERPAVIARELTKMYEEFRRGTLGGLADNPGVVRGEIVVLVGGAPAEEAPDAENLMSVVKQLLQDGYSASRAAKEAARRTGASRNAAYAVVLSVREGN